MSNTDFLTPIPEDVIKSAITVARWVEAHLPGMQHVQIYGVGVRTFLSVQAMLDQRGPHECISELKDG